VSGVDSFQGDLKVGRVYFNAYEFSIEADASHAGCSAAHEWINNRISWAFGYQACYQVERLGMRVSCLGGYCGLPTMQRAKHAAMGHLPLRPLAD
jgi:hypothetical protein